MSAPQSDPFLPLPVSNASSGSSQDFRVLVLDHPKNVQPFRSAEQGGNGMAFGPGVPHPGCDPRVSLMRDVDRFTAIHIQGEISVKRDGGPNRCVLKNARMRCG